MYKPYISSDRKDVHLKLALDDRVRSNFSAGFDSVKLTHCALPEINLSEVQLGLSILNRELNAPLFIGAMTGGTSRSNDINRALARIAAVEGIGLAVGSQRASLEQNWSQAELRNLAPSVPLIGNLGGIQLAGPGGLDLARRAVDDLEADALAIHLNPLQEAVQPEGESDWKNVANAIEKAVASLPCKIIVKEVGAGISVPVAKRLIDCGVWAIDVAGLGGTNWTRIEAARRNNTEIYAPFLDWGIPTVTCLRDVKAAIPKSVVIASGGVRHGLDAAKAIWLGSSIVSIAGPILRALVGQQVGAPNETAARSAIKIFKAQMRLAFFLTGANNIEVFRSVDGHIS